MILTLIYRMCWLQSRRSVLELISLESIQLYLIICQWIVGLISCIRYLEYTFYSDSLLNLTNPTYLILTKGSIFRIFLKAILKDRISSQLVKELFFIGFNLMSLRSCLRREELLILRKILKMELLLLFCYRNIQDLECWRLWRILVS